MRNPPLTEHTLQRAVAELTAADARLSRIVETHGVPSLRAATGGLAGLLHIVTEQFLSLLAARAIWARVTAALDPLTADSILAHSEDSLMALGLSRAKARSFHGIARQVADGSFVFAALDEMDDAAARKALLALPGVGPWTADVYLLSALLRPDVFPAGDLALQQAAADLFGLTARPSARAVAELALPFQPWRAVFARLLWSHYRGLRKLPQAGQSGAGAFSPD